MNQLEKAKVLESTIAEKLQELDVNGPVEFIEVLGSASVLLLNIMADFMGQPIEAVKVQYARSIMTAEIFTK
jgi:hypothetical protein